MKTNTDEARVLREVRGYLDQALAAAGNRSGATSSPWKNLGEEERAFAEYLEQVLPPVVSRDEVSTFIAGMNPKTLANDDSAGEGPAHRVMLGGKIYYTRADFIAYLVRKGIRVIPANPLGRASRKPAGAGSQERRASCQGSDGRSA